MYLVWDLNNVFSKNSNIIFLSIFLVCLFILLITLIYVSIYRKQMQTIAKSLDLIKDIKNSPLKYRIERISKIYDETGNFETEFMVWRTKYEILYEKEFLKLFIDFHKLLESKKTSKVRVSNINLYKNIYNRLIAVNKNVHLIYIEIMNSLEMEFIQRDALTYQKELFRDLKEEIIMTTFRDLQIDDKKLASTIESIEELFADFYNMLNMGLYKESWEELLKIDQSLIFLIELLDSIPYIISTIQNVIPRQLIDLKNKYVTFGNNKGKLQYNANKFSDLENEVDKLRVTINNEILKLQYKKAYNYLETIFDKINEFKIIIEEEDNIKTFFENRIDNIRQIFIDVENAVHSLNRKFNVIEPYTKTPSQEKMDFELVRKNFFSTKNKWDLILSDIDIAISKGSSIDFINLKERLLVEMTSLVDIIEGLEKSIKIISRKSVNTESLVNQVIFIKSCLSQCKVKIKQYKSIEELEIFSETIEDLFTQVSKYNKAMLTRINSQDERQKVSELIESILKNVTVLITDLNDTIFLDYISQEIMIYLERYVGEFKEIENVIYSCEDLFKRRNLEQLIGYALDILLKIKNKKN
ncbi:septation ring formation regulator [Spiroplasma corruscae]|uniref:Septation ring formation regulator n=1 Tax=Spiroplasma corruscae TaxID=216934 RepID=A0A222EN68_9MOLU|nr:septation ring formation regulator EzrA [Spiroplasma corruscae]ASP27928.1 septation ring formation regulator [Spiroplasma corruscae]